MNCELAQTTLQGYFDQELDAVRAAEFERHLQHCAVCQATVEGMEVLRARLREAGLYEPASRALREQVRKQLVLHEPADHMPALSLRRWRFATPLAVAAAAVALAIVFFLIQPHTRITAELIDAHVRSLQPGHLMDVQSTDQHTVKPWFDGKLDFIPPVADYSEQGFPLLGGRLDVAHGHSIAALVYGRRKHIINLFVWPVAGGGRFSDGAGSQQGYNWILWQAGETNYCLVSDVSAADLRELKELIIR